MFKGIMYGVVLLASVQARAEDCPNPNEVYVRNIAANGSGCY